MDALLAIIFIYLNLYGMHIFRGLTELPVRRLLQVNHYITTSIKDLQNRTLVIEALKKKALGALRLLYF